VSGLSADALGPGSFVWEALSSALGRPAGVMLLAAVAGAFLLGGVVKGTLGVGLPLVIVPVLALMIPSPKAIALMGIPILTSNVWQAVDGGRLGESVRRFGPLMAALVVTTALTVRATLGLPVDVLDAMVAVALLIAVVLMVWNPRLSIDARGERRWGLLVGVLSGGLGGVSSMMGPIVIAYLVALRLPREQFIGSISVIYLAGALPLYLSLAALDVLGLPELLLSSLALLPMFAGMALGKRLRSHVGEVLFRRLLLAFLSGVALLLLTR
jgi:uncharacterized membrane protein YfcA